MDVQDVVAKARDAITVKRVFGAPYERDGITVIPAAAIGGGAGGGGGEDTEGGTGSGGGFGITARPVGAYVIKNGEVRWEPAMDITRVALRGQALAAAAILVWFLITRRG
jgi:uncharacterized spore protein YtfJ